LIVPLPLFPTPSKVALSALLVGYVASTSADIRVFASSQENFFGMTLPSPDLSISSDSMGNSSTIGARESATPRFSLDTLGDAMGSPALLTYDPIRQRVFAQSTVRNVVKWRKVDFAF
jgi:hypothetical protein